jgi:SAM-dependent methyltransferase
MSADEAWWHGFFGGLWLETQPVFWSPEQTHAQVDFVERVLGLPEQARILDVPCGDGRLCIELASRGYHVTGVDLTPHFLERARSRARERQLEVVLEERDMRDLPWNREFDGALCWWGSFGYFDDAGNATFLRAVAQALRPGARFIVDTHVAESLLTHYQPRGWQQVGDVYVLQERTYDHTRSRMQEVWTFMRGDRVETRRFSIRVYTYRELCELLAVAGFDVDQGYGSLSGDPFETGARRLHLVAQKQADSSG